LKAFDHYLVMEDVELGLGDDSVWLAHGPKSTDVRVDGAFTAELDLTGLGGAPLLGPPSVGSALEEKVRSPDGAAGDRSAGGGRRRRRERVGSAPDRAGRAALPSRLRREHLSAGGVAREASGLVRQGLLPRTRGRLHAGASRSGETKARARDAVGVDPEGHAR